MAPEEEKAKREIGEIMPMNPGIEAARQMAHLGYKFEMVGEKATFKYEGVGPPDLDMVRPLVAAIREHKPDVLAYLSKPAPPEPDTPEPCAPKEKPKKTLFHVMQRHSLIRKLYREGKTTTEIVEAVGISRSTVNDVLRKVMKKRKPGPQKPGVLPTIPELAAACCGEKIKCPDCHGEHYCMKKKGHDGLHYMVCPDGPPYTKPPGPEPKPASPVGRPLAPTPTLPERICLCGCGKSFIPERHQTHQKFFDKSCRYRYNDAKRMERTVAARPDRKPRGTAADYKERMARIKELHQAGKNGAEIMTEIGCSRTTVTRIIKKFGPPGPWSGGNRGPRKYPPPAPAQPQGMPKVPKFQFEDAPVVEQPAPATPAPPVPPAQKRHVGRPRIIPEQPKRGFWAWIMRIAKRMMERQSRRRAQKAAKMLGITPESVQALIKRGNDQG